MPVCVLYLLSLVVFKIGAVRCSNKWQREVPMVQLVLQSVSLLRRVIQPAY
jgi:hypothetical protein